jgi:hypothetical protein
VRAPLIEIGISRPPLLLAAGRLDAGLEITSGVRIRSGFGFRQFGRYASEAVPGQAYRCTPDDILVTRLCRTDRSDVSNLFRQLWHHCRRLQMDEWRPDSVVEYVHENEEMTLCRPSGRKF